MPRPAGAEVMVFGARATIPTRSQSTAASMYGEWKFLPPLQYPTSPIRVGSPLRGVVVELVTAKIARLRASATSVT
jgi:hypothetical protein